MWNLNFMLLLYWAKLATFACPTNPNQTTRCRSMAQLTDWANKSEPLEFAVGFGIEGKILSDWNYTFCLRKPIDDQFLPIWIGWSRQVWIAKRYKLTEPNSIQKPLPKAREGDEFLIMEGTTRRCDWCGRYVKVSTKEPIFNAALESAVLGD